jgi:predicted double-glycine peptidase
VAVLPRGVTFGCGAAALAALILVFAGGAFMASGGIVQLMDLTFGMSMGELRGMYQPDVTDAQKKELEGAIESLREGVRTERVPVSRLDPVLQTMRKGISDQKMTAAEVKALTAAASQASRPAKPAAR